MALILRQIKDILCSGTANPHYFSDEAERKIARVIAEMDRDVDGVKQSVVDAMTGEKQLAKEMILQRQKMDDCYHKAELMLKDGRENKARMFLCRKKEHEKSGREIEKLHRTAMEESAALKNKLAMMERHLAQARLKKNILTARHRSAQASQKIHQSMGRYHAGPDSASPLGRFEQQISEMESRAEAVAELYADRIEVDFEFEKASMEKEVDDELAELSEKIKTQAPQ